MTGHSFYPHITYPTRFSKNNASLIDQIWCRLSDISLDSTSGILVDKFSDHQPYFTILNSIDKFEQPPTFVNIRKQDDQSVKNFEAEIEILLLQSKFFCDTHDDPNGSYNALHDIIQTAKAKHMPDRLVKYNKYKHKKSPWITFDIIKSIESRDKLYKKSLLTDPNSHEYEVMKVNLKTLNSIIKKNIRASKKQYYDKLFNQFKSDIKGTWDTLNNILCRNKCKKTFPKYFKSGDKILTNKHEIANEFNTFFTNIGQALANKFDNIDTADFSKYLTKSIKFNFNFKHITELDINNIIDKLPSKSSFGFDGISTKLIKSIKSALIKPLT